MMSEAQGQLSPPLVQGGSSCLWPEGSLKGSLFVERELTTKQAGYTAFLCIHLRRSLGITEMKCEECTITISISRD